MDADENDFATRSLEICVKVALSCSARDFASALLMLTWIVKIVADPATTELKALDLSFARIGRGLPFGPIDRGTDIGGADVDVLRETG